MKSMIKGAALILAIGLLSGCATSRSVVDLDAKTNVSTPAVPVPMPAGPAPGVTIAAVEDQRVFRIDPPVPEEPSLKNDEDINNKAITARAIARKRNTYGMAMGDVLLPEGDTVTTHVTQAITDGFATAGYRVLKTGEAGYDQAASVTVSIKQYWCWAQPGFFEAKLNCITEIVLASKLASLAPESKIGKQLWVGVQFGVDSEWRKVNQMALKDLTDELAALLKAKAQSAAGS
jgi:hypothetical protein